MHEQHVVDEYLIHILVQCQYHSLTKGSDMDRFRRLVEPRGLLRDLSSVNQCCVLNIALNNAAILRASVGLRGAVLYSYHGLN